MVTVVEAVVVVVPWNEKNYKTKICFFVYFDFTAGLLVVEVEAEVVVVVIFFLLNQKLVGFLKNEKYVAFLNMEK